MGLFDRFKRKSNFEKQEAKQILPGWKLHFEELSNNVYNVELRDSFGKVASTTDDNLERALGVCEGYAFDIEKQVSRNWSRFLFDYALLKVSDKSISEKKYHDQAFGSWFIVSNGKRLIYDGRDDVLIVEDLKDNVGDWAEYKAIAIKDLSFDKYNEFVGYLNG
jgi:hypothetical protein